MYYVQSKIIVLIILHKKTIYVFFANVYKACIRLVFLEFLSTIIDFQDKKA